MASHIPRAHVALRFADSSLTWLDEQGGGGAAKYQWFQPLPKALLAFLGRKSKAFRAVAYDTGEPATLPVFVEDEAPWRLAESIERALPPPLAAACTVVIHRPAAGGRTPLSVPFLVGRPVIGGFEAVDLHQPGLAPAYDDILHIALLGEAQIHRLDRLSTLRVAFSSTPPEGGGPARIVLDRSDLELAIVRNVLHDMPLHDAVRYGGDPTARLFADPTSNHDLRLSDLADEVAEQLVDAEISGHDALSALLGDPVRSERLHFGHESGGAQLLTWARSQLDVYRSADPHRGLGPDEPEAGRTRVVDLRLRRLAPSPLCQGRSVLGAVFVEPNDRLRRNTRYELRFQIGLPAQNNLIAGPGRPIDPDLPELHPGEFHPLDVVVHPQDFTLHSPALQRVRLGTEGPSEAVRFVVETPSAGRARLRVSVYLRNSLIQSFRLQARVGAEERVLAGAGPSAVLDFSRAPDFAALEQAAGTRALCISLNDAAAGAHDVMLKGTDGQAVIADGRITLQQATQVLASYRAVIGQISTDKFGQCYRIGQAPSEKKFREDVTLLALEGLNMRQTLFGQNVAAQPLLRALRAGQGLTVQVNRLGRLSLPFAVFYDWHVPDTPAEICLGQDCGHSHTDQTNTLCVRGFWGVRHRLEQLVHTGMAYEKQRPPGPFRVVVDSAQNYWKPLLNQLEPPVEVAPPAQGVLDALEAAPAVLALLGHHAATGTPAPAFPQIQIGPGGRRISRKDLQGHCNDTDPWTHADRPVVLLMACDTANHLDPYDTFVQPLLTKGAAAVVATDCVIYPDLAAHVTRKVLGGLARGRALGEVVRTMHQELLREHIPLGFVVTTIGDADLVIR